MIRNPIVKFEIAQGAAESSLIQLAEARLNHLSENELHDVYVRMREAAERGSLFAMCMCSTWRASKQRPEPSAGERFDWAKLAAEAGYAPGLYQLGFCYQNEIGVARDLVRSQELYERALAAGFSFAAYHLGMSFMEGTLGSIDVQKAVRFMERAYELGEASGALALGSWFETGERLAPDSHAAAGWYERASALGDFTASHRLQQAYTLGELGLARDATKAKQYEQLVFAQTEPVKADIE